jgi:ATP-dependent DNA helicase RecG
VPEAAPTTSAVLAKLGLPRGAFRASGPPTQESSEDDLIALYAGHQRDTYDATMLADAEMGDIDPARAGRLTPAAPCHQPAGRRAGWGDPELLRALGARSAMATC